MKFEEVIPLFGDFGRYQKRIYLLISLPTICCALHKLAWVFLGAQVEFRCKLPYEGSDAEYSFSNISYPNMSFPIDSKTGDFSKCERYDANFTDEYFEGGIKGESVSCGGQYIYDKSKYENSAVTEYNLVCDRKDMHANAQAVFMLGILIGSILFGDLSDRFGRRPIFFLSLVIQVVFGVIAGFAPDYYTFILARMVVGSSTSGVFLVGFVIAMEMVGPSKRMIAGVVCQYFFTAGFLVTAVFAYFIRDWHYLQLGLSLPGLVFLSYYWFLPESVRWLLTQGRKEEAIVYLKKAAKENKVEIPDSVYEELNAEKKAETVGLLSIAKYPRLRLRSINIFFSWFVNSGVYYGLSLNTSNLGGNDFINFAISGAVEIPAYTILLFSLNRVGRRAVLFVCMLLGGIFMTACAAVPEDLNYLLIFFSMVGKLCITASYGVIYILTAENFPTSVRNAGVGASSMFARVGGILAGYILPLKDTWKPLPLLIFGGISIIGALLSLFIPETLGKRLPESLEDGEKFGTSEYEPDDIEDKQQVELSTKISKDISLE